MPMAYELAADTHYGLGIMTEWGSEVYWLLPKYSSTTKEVKSGPTSYPACLTYLPR